MSHFDFSVQGLLVDASALAAVALIGYLFGRRQRGQSAATVDPQLLAEIARAQRIARDVERIASRATVEADGLGRRAREFQSRLIAMQNGAVAADWQRLRSCADALLGPTLGLITNLTLAADQLRDLQSQLITFSGSRIDPSTGLQNRRSLDEQLQANFSIHASGKRRFALALFSVTPAGPDDPETGPERLPRLARLLEQRIRDDDFVARYSEDELVVLMPQTALAGAVALSERLLAQANEELSFAMWGGVVEAAGNETPEKLLSRADSALYSARAAGDPCLYQHNGVGVRRHAAARRSAEQQAACGEERSAAAV